MVGHQRQAIAFVDVIYRDDVDLGAQSRISAGHGGSKAKNGEATDDTDYRNVPSGPAGGSPAAQKRQCYACPSPTPP